MTPRVVALLSWWEEDPAWLARCVTSIGRVADHLAAIDGAYQHTPGAFTTPRSNGHQADVIAAAADACGLGLTIHRPTEPWEGDEVSKRSFLFRLAALVAEPGIDWLFVIDADEVVVEAPANLRDQLAAYAAAGFEVGEVYLSDLPERGLQPARRFFRADETLRVEGAHYVYVAGAHDAPRYFWGDPDVHTFEPAALVQGFRMEHWSKLRAPERRQVALDYYERRDRHGLESPLLGRVPSGGSPVYAFEPRPGSCEFAMYVSPEEFDAVFERGWATHDEQRATVIRDDCDRDSGLLRLRLEQPYQVPA